MFGCACCNDSHEGFITQCKRTKVRLMGELTQFCMSMTIMTTKGQELTHGTLTY